MIDVRATVKTGLGAEIWNVLARIARFVRFSLRFSDTNVQRLNPESAIRIGLEVSTAGGTSIVAGKSTIEIELDLQPGVGGKLRPGHAQFPAIDPPQRDL